MAPRVMVPLHNRWIELFVLHILLFLIQKGAFASNANPPTVTTQLSVTRSSLVGDIYCLVNYNITAQMNITLGM